MAKDTNKNHTNKVKDDKKAQKGKNQDHSDVPVIGDTDDVEPIDIDLAEEDLVEEELDPDIKEALSGKKEKASEKAQVASKIDAIDYIPTHELKIDGLDDDDAFADLE